MTYDWHILVLNGPNLNLLGFRETKYYGNINLNQIITQLIKEAALAGVSLKHQQFNAEDKLIEEIQKSYDKVDFILLNPASFTHTSIAIRDALLATNLPFIEVHISNIYARESFRQRSYFSDIAVGTINGFGYYSYSLAMKAALHYLQQQR